MPELLQMLDLCLAQQAKKSERFDKKAKLDDFVWS